jgi:hypothetical protein
MEAPCLRASRPRAPKPARDTLGGALAVGGQLAGPDGGALIEAARDASRRGS